jgi:hypothetical protein
MPKRMTVTEKWNDEWFLSLSPQSKVIWEYLRDNCDMCGVFEVNLELMRFRIKFSPKVNIIEHINELNINAEQLDMDGRIEWFENKRRIWIKNFIKVQYGILTQNSAPHRGVIKALENHTHTKGLPKGLRTLIGTLKDKAKDKDKERKTEIVREPNIPFEAFWAAYDKKIDRGKVEKMWIRLSDEDRTACMNFIPRYKLSQPIKNYRRDPSTFLNNRSWENEIITPDGEQPDQPANISPRLKKI